MKNTRKPRAAPRYESILEHLLREIASVYAPGQRFHTQRDLMQRYDASYATIGRVLRELKARKIIATHTGKGIFIQSIPPSPSLKTVKLAVFSMMISGSSD